MYQGLGFSVSDLENGWDLVAAAPTEPQPTYTEGWGGILEQVGQAGADWLTTQATDVPTYGGAPAYPVNGGGYTTEPPIVAPESGPAAMIMGGAPTGLLVAGGALLAAKLLGFF